VQGDVGDAGAAPERDLAVAVLAGDVGVDVLHRHVAPPGDEEAEARAVEHRAAAQHPLARPAGELQRDVGHHVDRVGHHQQDGPRRQPHEIGDQLAADGRVRAGQVHARLARLLFGAGGDHNDVGVDENDSSA